MDKLVVMEEAKKGTAVATLFSPSNQNILTGSEIAQLFLNALQASKVLSKSSLSKYNQASKHFLRFCFSEKMQLGGVAVRTYISTIKHELSQGNYKIHRATARKVNDFAIAQGYILNTSQFKQASNQVANDSFELLINDFLASSDISQRSKKSYKVGLNEFASFTQENCNHSFEVLTKKTVLAFKDVKRESTSPYTVNSYLASIRQFSKHLLSNAKKLNLEDIESELTQITSVKNLKLDTNTYSKKGLTSKQQEKLMQSITDPQHKAIIALMMLGGLRIKEVTTILQSDFEGLENRQILRVLGKGRHEKKDFIVISSELQSILDACQNLNFFSTYSTQKIRKVVNGYLKQINAYEPYKVTCHSLRHTIAQNLLREGKGIETVKAHLRHKSVVSTEKYTNQIAQAEYIKTF